MKTLRGLILLLSTLLLAACNFTLAADVTPPPNYRPTPIQTQPAPVSGPLFPLVPASAADGQAIYTEKCAPCHGESGLGDGPQAAQLPNPVAALGNPELARRASPAVWYQIVTQGNIERFMPPFPSLSDRQRWDVVAYAFSLSSPQERLTQADELYTANCASCHGPEGKGDGSQAQALDPKPGDWTDTEAMAAQSAEGFFQAISNGVGTGMPAFADQLGEEERWTLAEYVRAHQFASSPAEAAVAPDETSLPNATVSPVDTPAAEVTATAVPTSTLGVISGSVVNASGGAAPEGLKITLHGFDQMQTVITQTASVQADGSFKFENVELAEGRFFLTTTEYEGATYGSEIAPVEAGVTSMVLPINVYETTTDASGLVADRLHLFFEFKDEQTLRVIELYIISNPGDKTVIPPAEGQPAVSFVLPEGASNLQFQDGALGERYVETEKGFGDTIPVRPGSGSYQVLYAYELPFDRKLELEQPMTLPSNAVVVLVPENTIKVEGENLQDAGTRDVEGVPYHMLNIPSMKAGDVLRLTVSGSPGGVKASLPFGSNTELMVGLAAFGIVLVGAGVWIYRRSRAEQPELDEDEPDLEIVSEQETPDSLMDAILALDDQYKSGNLSEEAYQQRRAELKERLRLIVKKDADGS